MPFLTPPRLGALGQQRVVLPDQGPRGTSPYSPEPQRKVSLLLESEDLGIGGSPTGNGGHNPELEGPQGSSHLSQIRS